LVTLNIGDLTFGITLLFLRPSLEIKKLIRDGAQA
jgi:hypothetical protein